MVALNIDTYTLLATCKRLELSPEETTKLLSDEFEKLFGMRLILASGPTLGVSVSDTVVVKDKASD